MLTQPLSPLGFSLSKYSRGHVLTGPPAFEEAHPVEVRTLPGDGANEKLSSEVLAARAGLASPCLVLVFSNA